MGIRHESSTGTWYVLEMFERFEILTHLVLKVVEYGERRSVGIEEFKRCDPSLEPKVYYIAVS